ncbi:MAG: hypothetical protein PHW69_09330 [Elusimicrobiaceae bacterium]|nr:hypothetical protein [Elusimicrobiaceae bacterium]
MKKKMFLACVLLLAQMPAFCASTGVFSLGEDIDTRWLAGIQKMYRLDFDGAQTEFQSLIVSSPTHPAGYLALAALNWWKFSQNYDKTGQDTGAFETEFLSYANKAVTLSDSWIDSGGDEASASFIMGTAYGLMARWYAVERSWWSAFVKGKKGRKYLQRALKLNPGIYDAYVGLGIYDYYAASIPGFLRLPSLLFVRGDKTRGKQELESGIKNGRFFNTEAELFYISILVQFEKDYKKAARMCAELQNKDKDNVFFQFVDFATHFNMNDWEYTITQGSRFIAMLPALEEHPLSQQAALFFLAVGDGHVAKMQFGQAISMFNQGIDNTPYKDKGWVTFCYLRRGQVYDVLGEREAALKDYKVVLSRPDFWDSAVSAKKGVSKPYTYDAVLSEINAH